MRKFLCCLLFLGVSCSRTSIKSPAEAMRLTLNPPPLVDALSRESFFVSLRKHIDVIKTTPLVKDPMVFGKTRIGKSDYVRALEEIFQHEQDWTEWIAQNFEFHEVYGNEEWAQVLSTGYYEPVVKGARTETETYSQPAYARPKDLVTIDLKAFSYKFSKGLEHASLQGRLSGKKIVPYYARKDIDVDKKLKGQGLELAWLDPIDAFFIQIQGSGVVEFPDGNRMRIGYADQNGHPYVAIGKHLLHAIPMEQMSMQRIRQHLQGLSRPEQQSVLNGNPSYVFFRPLSSAALTYSGVEVSDGRTIATDKGLLPKGALAFLDIEEPEFESASSTVPIAWLRRPRLVFDQDTGGAIKGPGRIDLYFGQGETAAQKAGVMKRSGKLFYLVPKK